MAAFELARHLGADGIEFDVQSTSDGQLVVIHDATLDRTTNGTGPVVETDEATIHGLDAGSWFAAEFVGERVPRLTDVLALSGLEFELELKSDGPGFLDHVLDTVDRVAPHAWIEFTSSNVSLLERLKKVCPTARVGLFSGAITSTIAAHLHSSGFEVHANDADMLSALRNAVDVGADRVSTRDLHAAAAVRGARS